MKLLRYSDDLRERWNEFALRSKNGTFLFNRDYMEYHRDRFEDQSFVLLDADDRWVALFPAARKDAVTTSHAGLTYGGLVVDGSMTTAAMLDALRSTADTLAAEGAERLRYKTVPAIYHKVPAEEDRYALFRAGARLYRRDVLSVVNLRAERKVQERRKRGVKRAERAGIEIRRSDDWPAFFRVLQGNLADRHDTKPVHSCEEMRLLAGRFPRNIILFGAFRASELLGGAVVYESDLVAHVQYIASSADGRELSCLDLLFERLIGVEYAAKAWFDFGSSTEDEGRTLNEGLAAQKEGFGARAVAHDFYEMDLR
jgi:hypothetical protein